MPFTAFHAVFPWFPYIRWPRAFSFWAITWGAMVPDLEVVPSFLVTKDIYLARGIMHSVLGVLTLNALITAVVVRYAMPRALAWFTRREPNPAYLRFAGQDLRKDPADLATVYASAAFGGLTHILVDIPVHAYNPLLWPWQTVPFAVLPFADQPWWDLLTGVFFLAAFVAMVAKYWRR